MPAVSKKQQRFFGIVRSIQKGEQKPTTPETAKAASSMKMKSVKKFAKTKHKGLPEKKKVDENLSFTFGTDKGFDVNVYGILHGISSVSGPLFCWVDCVHSGLANTLSLFGEHTKPFAH